MQEAHVEGFTWAQAAGSIPVHVLRLYRATGQQPNNSLPPDISFQFCVFT